MKSNLFKKIFVFFLILFLFKPTWLLNLNSLGDDELSYWLHSATIAFDFDINYENDFEVNESWTFNNKNVPSHPPGSGYMNSFFVFLFDLVFERDFDKNVDRLNPVGSFWILGYFFSTLFYIFLGFYFLRKALLSISNNEKVINLVLFLTFLSSLSNFVLNRFMLSHPAEFFLVCLILFTITRKKINFYLLLTSFFFLSITRPTTFLITLLLIPIFSKNLKKINFNKLNTSFLLFLTALYIYLSRTLYNSFYIFTNTYREDPIDSIFNDASILEIIFDIPSLFVSPSMGLIYISPIIFLSLVVMALNINKISIFELLIILSGLAIVLIWQGKDVTFGQRFLIGQLPIASFIFVKYYKNNKFINFYIWTSLIFSYFGNLYFYSSELLTLSPGKNLFGQNSQLAAENYFYNLPLELLDINVHLSMMSRTIFFIIIVKIFRFEKIIEFIESFGVIQISEDKYSKLIEYTSIYENYSNPKFMLLLLSLLLFSLLMTNIFIRK